MNVLAVSDFIRSLLLILVAAPFILLWGAAIVDVIRRGLSGWAIVGWMVLILVLPIIGPLIYFAIHKPTPTPSDVEQQYLAQRDLARQAAATPFDSTAPR